MKSVLKYFCLFWSCLFIAGCDEPGKQHVYVIDAPLTGLNQSPEKKTISTDRQQRVIFSDGFSVSVPENAFVDGEGKPVQGAVELSLKKYTSVASILGSGIPMHYQGEDGEGIFQSAGMFDIRASANGELLELAKGKELKVGFPTKVKGDYDFFKFEESGNPSEGRWVREISKEKESAELPQATDSFRLQWNLADFPELRFFENIDWYLATKQRNPGTEQHQWVLDTKWDAFRLSQPRLGFESPIKSDGIDQSVFTRNFVMEGGAYFSFAKETALNVYKQNGDRIAHYDALKSNDTIMSFEYLTPELIEISTLQGTVLFDWQHNKSFKFEGEFIRSINKSSTRVLTSLPGSLDEVFLNSLEGEVLESFKVEDDDWIKERKTGINSRVFFTESYVIQSDLNGLKQFDMNGELIRGFNQVFSEVRWLENDLVLCVDLRGNVSMLDLVQSKFTSGDFKGLNMRDSLVLDGNSFSWYSSRISSDTSRNIVFLNEAVVSNDPEKNTVLWNYETNKVSELDFVYASYFFSDGQDLILGTNFTDSTLRVFDLNRFEEVYLGKSLYPVGLFSDAAGYYAKMNKGTRRRVLIDTGLEKKLLDSLGNIVLDFEEYDTSIYSPGFIRDTLVAAYARDNTYSVWNLDGELLEQSNVREKYAASYFVGSQGLNTSASIPNVRKRYRENGRLEYDFAGFERTVFLSDSMVLQLSEDRWELTKTMNLPPNAWQLNLTKGDKEFYTYIYLTDEVTQRLEPYEKRFLEWVEKETERQERLDRFVRRYNISSMGLYNCDIVLRVPEALVFAANFRIDGEALPEGARIFDLMESEGYVVAEITDIDWEKYPIDPNLRHRFVAILPNNQLALFDFNDFEKIDWEKVRQEGTYTFSIKKIEGSFEKSEDLERLFSPEPANQELN